MAAPLVHGPERCLISAVEGSGTLPEVLQLLAVSPQPEVFRTSLGQMILAKAWAQVQRFYHLDIILKVTHAVLAAALTWQLQEEEHDAARPKYLLCLLAGVSLLVFKGVLDEAFQLRKLGLGYLKLGENWFGALRVCTEIAAMLILWLKWTTVPPAIISAWMGCWTWVHFLTKLRGLHGLGHVIIPLLEAIFDMKVSVMGCMVVICVLGAMHGLQLCDICLGYPVQWVLEREVHGRKGCEVCVQEHVFTLLFIFLVPMPLFISVLGKVYSLRVQRASESFLRTRAMLAVKYDAAALPCLMRTLRWPASLVMTRPGSSVIKDA